MADDEKPVMLVAGGTGSIGRVIARQALDAGWRVALHGSRAQSVEAVIDGLSKTLTDADRIKGFPADVHDSSTIAPLVEQVAAWHGRIDAVVDCISTGPAKRLTGLFNETDPDGYAAFMDLSIANLQRLVRASLPWLAQQGGTLIAFASDAGRFAAPRQSIVGASRAAIMGFVRNLALEVARDGVRVHCVSPSFVDDTETARRLAAANADRVETARRKAGLGLPTPEDIAPLVIFLCGEGARRITGQVISVNGGVNA
jgi:NAD(P)-dependent dehydrogenase (short-subunit alcohol dehydrogenase family)